MSVDLAVWEGPPPVSDAEAITTFERLCEQFPERASVPPTDAIAAYVQGLLARYPDLAGEDQEPSFEVPWGSGPLLGNASGPIVYIDMKLNGAFREGWRYCVDLATSLGLVAFDPQAGALADPNPTAVHEPAMPDDTRRASGIGARLYRWSSLRSYRWPVLVPLASFLRRFR